LDEITKKLLPLSEGQAQGERQDVTMSLKEMQTAAEEN